MRDDTFEAGVAAGERFRFGRNWASFLAHLDDERIAPSSRTSRARATRARYREYKRQRGMSMTHDWVDWLGGYPYEVARPDQVQAFCRERGFALERHRDSEYLFRKA